MRSMVSILEEYRVDHRIDSHEHCRPGWIQIDCPYCSPGWGHFRMGFCTYSPHFHCWACGHHQTLAVLSIITNLDWNTCKKLFDGVEVDTRYVPERAKDLINPKGLSDLASPHANYLKGRGFDPKDLVSKWQIKSISVAPRLQWRIYIPIVYQGQVVSWTTRAIIDAEGVLRYQSAAAYEETVNHKDLLYAEDLARNAIIICEGPLDVWKIGPGAVATFGTGYTKAQVNKMVRYPVRVVCFDAQKDAQDQARKLCRELEVFPGDTYNVVLDSAKDAGAASVEELQELRKKFLR